MADELKPCPFCGDDGIVRQCGGRDRKLVQCDICGISHFSWQDRPIEYSLLARAEAAEQLAEAAASQLRAAVDAFEAAEKRANDYHRRAQKMAAALAREIATGGGPSLGRALANAGYEAEKTLREAAEGKLEKVQEFALAYSASLSEFARFSIHAILAPDTGGEKGES
jgi:hypothetical protein